MSYLYNNWFWFLICLVLITIIIILLIKILKDKNSNKKKPIKTKVEQICETKKVDKSLEISEFSIDRSFYYKIADKLDSLYVSTVKYFKTDKSYIIKILKTRYKEREQKEVGESEYNSWLNNLGTISNLIEEANIHDSTLLIFEWAVFYNNQNNDKKTCKIDIAFYGSDINNRNSILTIELKNWSPNSVSLKKALESQEEKKHPFYQLKRNYFGVKEKLMKIDIKEINNIYSCIYMPNYMFFKNKKWETYVNDFLFKTEEYKFLEEFLEKNKNVQFFVSNNKYDLIKKLKILFSSKCKVNYFFD